jgi:hypothetical protein
MKTPQNLMDRKTRRRILFAPIHVHYYGGHQWGGHTLIDEEDNTPRKRSNGNEYVVEFKRRSGLNTNEGDE